MPLRPTAHASHARFVLRDADVALPAVLPFLALPLAFDMVWRRTRHGGSSEESRAGMPAVSGSRTGLTAQVGTVAVLTFAFMMVVWAARLMMRARG